LAPNLFKKIPNSFRLNAERFVQFCTNNLSTLSELAILTGVVALACFGHYSFVIGYVTCHFYHFLDRKGLVPYAISAFVEKYLPAITVSYVFYLNPGFFTGLNFCILMSQYLSTIAICKKVGRKILEFPIFGIHYLLKHFYDGLICGYPDSQKLRAHQKNMSFDHMKEVLLETDAEKFILCSEGLAIPSFLESNLENDQDLSKLEALFDSIDWASKQKLIISKFKADDRFADLVLQQGISKERIPSLSDAEWLQVFAKMETTPQDFLKKNFVHFISVCQKKLKFASAGSKSTLNDVIEKMYKINAYVLDIQKKGHFMEVEDLLLKLAVEAGEYCNLGYTRAVNEIIDQITNIAQIDDESPFESKLLVELEKIRKEVIQLSLSSVSGVVQDIHIYNQVEYQFLGFIPLKYKPTLFQFLIAHTFPYYNRALMMEVYRLFIEMQFEERMKSAHIITHLTSLIQESTVLKEDQKEHIMDLLTQGDEIPFDEIQKRANQLLLCMLGILKKKK
jgi:hypothetical protein